MAEAVAVTEPVMPTLNLCDTTLRAVSTGTITSGINAAVQGIVGLSGQSATGL